MIWYVCNHGTGYAEYCAPSYADALRWMLRHGRRGYSLVRGVSGLKSGK